MVKRMTQFRQWKITFKAPLFKDKPDGRKIRFTIKTAPSDMQEASVLEMAQKMAQSEGWDLEAVDQL